MKTVVLDKTGTVTSGVPDVIRAACAPGVAEGALLSTALSMEKPSGHPLAKAVVSYAEDRGVHAEAVSDFAQVEGGGVRAVIGGEACAAGNARLMEKEGVSIEGFSSLANQAAEMGATPLFFARGGKALGMMAVADAVKPTSAQAIRELADMGVRTVMITGDNERTARAVQKACGIGEVIAGVLPRDKAREVARLMGDGRVAMVGDGVNDAPALARADVGIAIGAGTDVAIESADVVLMRSDLLDVPAAIQLSRATMRTIKQNLFWALFYNVVCIPVAAGALSWAGISLNPMIASAAMSVSSVCVVSNALRLRGWKPRFLHGDMSADDAAAPHASAFEGLGLATGDAGANMPPDDGGVEDADAGVDASGADAALPGGFSSACTAGVGDDSKNESEGKEPVMEKTLHVEGMMCQNCVKHVKNALEGVEGVASANVDLEGKSAVVELSSDVPDDVLVAAVVEEGYEASMA